MYRRGVKHRPGSVELFLAFHKPTNSQDDHSDCCRDAGASGEETVPSQEDLEKEKYIFRDFIVEERYRGLNWLFVTTLMAIWVTGVLNKDSPLAP